MNPHDQGDGGEDEKQALPCDPAAAQTRLYCCHEH